MPDGPPRDREKSELDLTATDGAAEDNADDPEVAGTSPPVVDMSDPATRLQQRKEAQSSINEEEFLAIDTDKDFKLSKEEVETAVAGGKFDKDTTDGMKRLLTGWPKLELVGPDGKVAAEINMKLAPQFEHSMSVDHARHGLVESIENQFCEPAHADRFKTMMSQFEEQMGSSIDRRVAAGEDGETVKKEVETKIRDTYDQLQRLVSPAADAVDSPEQRLKLAESYMYHLANPETVTGGKWNTAGWLEPAYVIMMHNHPEKLAGILADVSLTGRFTDTKGRDHKFSPGELSSGDASRGSAWTIEAASVTSNPSPSVYRLDVTLGALAGFRRMGPRDPGSDQNVRNAMELSVGDVPAGLAASHLPFGSEKFRRQLAEDGGAMRHIPGHYGTWQMRREGDTWSVIRGDQYPNRDSVVTQIPADKLKTWIKTGEGAIPRRAP